MISGSKFIIAKDIITINKFLVVSVINNRKAELWREDKQLGLRLAIAIA